MSSRWGKCQPPLNKTLDHVHDHCLITHRSCTLDDGVPLQLKCDIVECLLDPALIPVHESYFVSD